LKRLFLYIILISIFLLDCTEELTEPTSDLYSVSGKVTNSNGPVPNAKVTVDKKANWETTTSASGDFTISNVSSGDHTLYIEKKGQDEDFVEMNYPMFVNTDLTLNNLVLPIPVRLYPPVNITQTEMTIKWNKTDAQDFREYKLYSKDTPGLDETTGELIYVSTSKNDTSFAVENLIPYETYYLRVYLMNQYGRLGGSNIESKSTLGGNLIPDGSFEDSSKFDEHWFIDRGNGDISYDDSIKIDGNYSLFGLIPYSVTLKSTRSVQLAAGKTYELSGWGKANGRTRSFSGWVRMTIQGNNFYQDLRFCVGPGNSYDSVDIDWTYNSRYFTPSENVSVVIELDGGFDRVWWDELKLEVVE